MSEIRVGHYNLANVSVKVQGSELYFNNCPITTELALVDYPCYEIPKSNVGDYVFVIGDKAYNYVRENKATCPYNIVDTKKQEQLSNIHIVLYNGAYYIINGNNETDPVIPIAFNAQDMQENMQEMHIYVALENANLQSMVIAIYDKAIDTQQIKLHKDINDIELTAYALISYDFKNNCITSIVPNITDYVIPNTIAVTLDIDNMFTIKDPANLGVDIANDIIASYIGGCNTTTDSVAFADIDKAVASHLYDKFKKEPQKRILDISVLQFTSFSYNYIANPYCTDIDYVTYSEWEAVRHIMQRRYVMYSCMSKETNPEISDYAEWRRIILDSAIIAAQNNECFLSISNEPIRDISDTKYLELTSDGNKNHYNRTYKVIKSGYGYGVITPAQYLTLLGGDYAYMFSKQLDADEHITDSGKKTLADAIIAFGEDVLAKNCYSPDALYYYLVYHIMLPREACHNSADFLMGNFEKTAMKRLEAEMPGAVNVSKMLSNIGATSYEDMFGINNKVAQLLADSGMKVNNEQQNAIYRKSAILLNAVKSANMPAHLNKYFKDILLVPTKMAGRYSRGQDEENASFDRIILLGLLNANENNRLGFLDIFDKFRQGKEGDPIADIVFLTNLDLIVPILSLKSYGTDRWVTKDALRQLLGGKSNYLTDDAFEDANYIAIRKNEKDTRSILDYVPYLLIRCEMPALLEKLPMAMKADCFKYQENSYGTSRIQISAVYAILCMISLWQRCVIGSLSTLADDLIAINNVTAVKTAEGTQLFNRHNTEAPILNIPLEENQRTVKLDILSLNSLLLGKSALNRDIDRRNPIGISNEKARRSVFANSIFEDFGATISESTMSYGLNTIPDALGEQRADKHRVFAKKGSVKSSNYHRIANYAEIIMEAIAKRNGNDIVSSAYYYTPAMFDTMSEKDIAVYAQLLQTYIETPVMDNLLLILNEHLPESEKEIINSYSTIDSVGDIPIKQAVFGIGVNNNNNLSRTAQQSMIREQQDGQTLAEFKKAILENNMVGISAYYMELLCTTLSAARYISNKVTKIAGMAGTAQTVFLKQYFDTYKKFNEFFYESFAERDLKQFAWQVFLATANVQNKLDVYTLENLNAVLDTTNVEDSTNVLLNQIGNIALLHTADDDTFTVESELLDIEQAQQAQLEKIKKLAELQSAMLGDSGSGATFDTFKSQLLDSLVGIPNEDGTHSLYALQRRFDLEETDEDLLNAAIEKALEPPIEPENKLADLEDSNLVISEDNAVAMDGTVDNGDIDALLDSVSELSIADTDATTGDILGGLDNLNIDTPTDILGGLDNLDIETPTDILGGLDNLNIDTPDTNISTDTFDLDSALDSLNLGDTQEITNDTQDAGTNVTEPNIENALDNLEIPTADNDSMLGLDLSELFGSLGNDTEEKAGEPETDTSNLVLLYAWETPEKTKEILADANAIIAQSCIVIEADGVYDVIGRNFTELIAYCNKNRADLYYNNVTNEVHLSIAGLEYNLYARRIRIAKVQEEIKSGAIANALLGISKLTIDRILNR